jgi:phospholipase/carboxylesterase
MSDSLYYIKRVPKKASENPPMLIMLHGYGSHEEDLFSFAEELPDELLIISARAPYSIGFGGHAWYAINFDADQNKFSDTVQARASLQLVDKLINELKAEFSPSKIFLLGFSQGAILSIAYSFNFPNKVNHVVALSGYLMQDIFPDAISSEFKTDYYVSHGTVDQVIPVQWARQTPEFMKLNNLSHEYSEYPVGHGVAPQNFYSFKDWIEKRLR